jgi:hypothetical protein
MISYIIYDVIYDIETHTYLTQTHTNSQSSLTVTVSEKAES